MLNRRKKIHKYISALKTKKHHLARNLVLTHKLQEDQNIKSKSQIHQNSFHIPSYVIGKQEVTEEDTPNCWEDEEDLQLDLQKKNVFTKLNLGDSPTEKQYEGKLKQFYTKKYVGKNWAIEGEGEIEQDLNDYLNQEEIYEQQNMKSSEEYRVDFVGRTNEKHNSVITGMDWQGKVLATCGYDQKLKLFSVFSEQQNSELKIKLEKDIYTERYSLVNCFFNKEQIYCGTLRQNFLVVDCNKWKTRFITSNFLSEHKTYQNLRFSKVNQKCLLFSNHRASLLDHNNSYLGSVLANDTILDMSFGKQHQLFGISNDAIYQWDLRNFKIVKLQKQNLNFTKLSVQGDVLASGNKLGIVRLSTVEEKQLKQYSEVSNLVTHITELKSNRDNSLMIAMSKWKPNAARVIDIHKGKCVANWPTNKTKIGFGTVAAFSDRNEMAVGSTNGYVSVFQVHKS